MRQWVTVLSLGLVLITMACSKPRDSRGSEQDSKGTEAVALKGVWQVLKISSQSGPVQVADSEGYLNSGDLAGKKMYYVFSDSEASIFTVNKNSIQDPPGEFTYKVSGFRITLSEGQDRLRAQIISLTKSTLVIDVLEVKMRLELTRTTMPEIRNPTPLVPPAPPASNVFDEATVGKAAHFVKITAPVEFKRIYKRGYDWEKSYQIKLTKSYEIQATDVTQLQWYIITKETPARFRKPEDCDPENSLKVKTVDRKTQNICKHHPVEQVSWTEVQEFIKKLNQVQSQYIYSLPTEAQWEYVANGRHTTKNLPERSVDFDELYTWFSANSKKQTHAVGTKRAISSPQNESDLLYDMGGQVWQITNDLFSERFWLDEDQLLNPSIDPTGPVAQADMALALTMVGGCWNNSSEKLFWRNSYLPENRSDCVGFRLVRVAK